ncbi:hypothetical protein AAFF_G00184410 [Aldrovandia affinis]|uniref:Uncharacterized protein n=1 Tax=Aldrovandia affinis TaxID=143900 RepID=A0AAD7RJW6_9TELE|nr:hypothetical protein AAFF_G00184410 [Aldrovandia affinis]
MSCRCKDILKCYVIMLTGGTQEPSTLGMMAPTVKSTATVAPLTSFSRQGLPLSHRSLLSQGTTPTAAARSSRPTAVTRSAESFAAALRKLAKLAEDPQGTY